MSDSTGAAIDSGKLTPAGLEGKTLVYGRIQWLENGILRDGENKPLNQNTSPRYLRIEDMGKGTLDVEPDGDFFWILPEGHYLMHQLHWFDPWDGPHRIDPKVAFSVPQDHNAVCLGTLQVDVQGKRDLIGGLWIKGRSINILDECDAIYAQHLASRFEKHTLLMLYQPELPARPDKLESRDQLIDFIRAIIPGLMTTIY